MTLKTASRAVEAQRPALRQDAASVPRTRTVSIVVPCLNEEAGHRRVRRLVPGGAPATPVATGQILIIDSSTDRSPEIAEEQGAEVLRVPKRGLGRAYIDAIAAHPGDYVIMGDCDLTYDFREIAPFLDKLDEGLRLRHGEPVRRLDRAGRHAELAPLLRDSR